MIVPTPEGARRMRGIIGAAMLSAIIWALLICWLLG